MFPREATLIYNVDLRIAVAEQNLMKLVARFKTLEERIAAIRTGMLQMSKEFNQPLEHTFSEMLRLIDSYKGLFKGDANLLTAGLADFYNAIQEGKVSQDVLQQMLSVDLEAAAAGASASLRMVGTTAQQALSGATQAAGGVNTAVKSTGASVTRLLASLSRFTAFVVYGQLVSQAFYQIVTSIQEAITRANDFYDAIFRLNNAAIALQERGLKTTGQDLLSFVDRLRREVGPLASELSRVELIKLISGVTALTANLNLSEEQLYRLVKAILILNKVSVESESVLNTMSKVVTSIVSPTGRGAATLGISLGRDILVQEAIARRIIKTVDEFDKLPQDVKVQLRFDVLTADAEKKMESISELGELPSTRLTAVKKRFEDIMTSVGNLIMSFVDNVVPALEIIASAFDTFVKILQLVGTLLSYVYGMLERAMQGVLTIAAGLSVVLRDFDAGIKLIKQGIQDLSNVFSAGKESARKYWLNAVPDARASNAVKNLSKDFSSLTDTITDAGSSINKSSMSKNLESFVKSIMDLYSRIKEKTDDFNRSMAREQEDLSIALRRLDEDHVSRRAQIVAEGQTREQQAIQKFNDWLINEEAQKNERLRQLRERFFLDMEDAIRARDAVQIIRLTRQYVLERQNIVREFNLQVEERRRQLMQELEEERAQRAMRLQEEAQEYALRRKRLIEDANIRMKRMQDDFQREIMLLREQIKTKLIEEANGIAKELNLRTSGMQILYQTILRYLGPGGLIDGLYQYSTQSAINAASMIVQQIRRILEALVIPTPSGGMNNIGGQAEGGVYFATGPTRAVFGEAGPELAIFLPLRKASMTVNSGTISRQHVMIGGMARIEVLPSEEFVGRVTSKTLENIEVSLRSIKSLGRP